MKFVSILRPSRVLDAVRVFLLLMRRYAIRFSDLVCSRGANQPPRENMIAFRRLSDFLTSITTIKRRKRGFKVTPRGPRSRFR